MNINNPDEDKKINSNKEFVRVAPYLTLSWQLIITIVIGAVIGYFVDKSNNSSPKYMIILMVTFTIIAFANLIRTVIKLNKEEDMKDKNVK